MNILLPLIIISAGFFNDAQTPELVTTSDSVSTEPEPIVTEAIVPEAAEPLVVVPEATEPEATEPEGDVSTAVNADSWPRQTESDLCGSVGIGQNRPQQNGNCSYHEGLSDVDEAWSHLAPSTRAAILMLVEADQMTRTE